MIRVRPDDALAVEQRARLQRAAFEGLRLAVALRTGALLLFTIWFVAWTPFEAMAIGASVLALFVALGIATLLAIGFRRDRAGVWSQPAAFALYGLDAAAISAIFALAPLSHGGDVPQIIAFRAYGVYFCFVPIAFAALALSPPLVLWTAASAIVGWLVAWGTVVSAMPETLSWSDISFGADRDAYLSVFLDPRFIGAGNRVQEAGILLVCGVVIAFAVARARNVFLSYVAAEADRRFLTDVFGAYVPQEAAAEILRTRRALAPRTAPATILILDIASFTAWSATRAPEVVIAELNAFLAECSEIVARHRGTAVSFIGDGMLAAFNTPRALDDHEARAVQAATALAAMAAARQFDGASLAVRIGLATGDVAAGSVGAAKRRAFTIYGEAVNRAQRLETLCKTSGRTILMDGATAKRAGASTISLGDSELRGLSGPVEVFGVADPRSVASGS